MTESTGMPATGEASQGTAADTGTATAVVNTPVAPEAAANGASGDGDGDHADAGNLAPAGGRGTGADDVDTDDVDTDDAGAEGAAPAGGARSGGSASDARDDLVAEGDAAGDYLERLLDILDYDGDIDLDVEGERAVVSIIGQGDVEKLVGSHGEVLDALQELTRLAAGMETGQRSRLMLDIAGFRAKRRAELTDLGRTTAEQVVASGTPAKLGAMNPFERKIVHDAVATVAGATSSSEGEEPHRRVVVTPTA